MAAGGGREVAGEVDLFLSDLDYTFLGGGQSGGGDGGPEPMDEGPTNQDGSGEKKDPKEQFWRQLMLFQYPLRPRERPYPTGRASEIRVKPRVQRVEVDIPLHTEFNNYREYSSRLSEVRETLESLTLRSSNMDLHTKHMVGVVKDGSVILVPLNKAFQLRPKMNFADPNDSSAGQQVRGSEGSAQQGLEVVTVQVQRHETKKQQEARYRSHAFLREQEEREPWAYLAVMPSSEDSSREVRRTWANAPSGECVAAVTEEEDRVQSESRNAKQLKYIQMLVKPAEEEEDTEGL